MGNATWAGIFPALCTPFDEDDAIDLVAQRRIVRFAIDAGAHGLVCFGLAGEVQKLAPEERRELAGAIVDEAAGRVPVLVGVGAENVLISRALARHAETIGASGIVLAPPPSTRLSGPELVDYFVAIAEQVAIPVMLQDASSYLGQAVDAEIVLRVAEQLEHVRLVKLEAGPSVLRAWVERLGGEFSVWGGDAGMYQLDALRVGAAGLIPGVDLVDLLVAVYEAEAAGDSARADALFHRVLPMIVFEIQHSIDHFNTCAKHVLMRRGVLANPALRQPASRLGKVSLSLLDEHLAALDLADVQHVAVS